MFLPYYRWPPTPMLLAARFSADLKELFEVTSLFFSLEQLQNRDFAILNRSKPTRVLTRRKSLYMLDCLPIGYSLIDFQPIWNNFKIEIFFGIWVYSSGPTITQKRSKKDVVAVARISDHSALPSSARSEASISFQIQCCKIWKGRRSCCEFFQLQIALNP